MLNAHAVIQLFEETSTVLTNCAALEFLLFEWQKYRTACMGFDHHKEAVKVAHPHAVALFHIRFFYIYDRRS